MAGVFTYNPYNSRYVTNTTMPTARRIDDNGFLLVKGCPLSSFGIFDYSAGQLGLPGDPMRIVKVFRPESAVNDPETLASFQNVPLINDHTMLSGFAGDKDNTAPEDYGMDGVLTGNVYYAAPWMRGDLKVFSRKMQNYLAKGKKDLSLGYSCDFEEKPGVWNGQAYEVVQTNLRGNHIALVGEGRVPGARVLDGMCFDHLSFDFKPSDKEKTMPAMAKAARDSAVEDLQKLIPALSAALEQFLTEEKNEAEHQNEPPAANPDDVASQIEGNANPAQAPPVDSSETDPNAEPVSEAPATPAEPQEGAAGNDLQALIAQAREVLAKLEGAAQGAPAADDDATQKPVGDVTESDIREDGTNKGGEVVADQVEPGKEGDQGKDQAPLGSPVATQDAALRHFYSDLAAKDNLYKRLSPRVGAFDHKAMDARQVASYGVKKLGIKCAAGTEAIALDAYLSGAERADAQTRKNIQTTKVADSAVQSTVEMDAYINGSK